MTCPRNSALVLITLLLAVGHGTEAASRPNVVLIVCDDLNDYVTGLGGHPQAHTPAIGKLAATGVSFRHAYSNNPICAPSRSSFLTGIYPHTSGNLFFDKWFQNPVLRNSRTLMHHFRANGYHVAGSGKLMHHPVPGEWSEYAHKPDYGPFVYDGRERIAHPSVPKPFADIGPVDGSYAPLSDVPFADDGNPESGWIYGAWGKTRPLRYNGEDDRDPTPDERNAAWAAQRIRQFAAQRSAGTMDQPFFLAVGFIRPHTPLHVPRKYFDRFPLDSLELPVIKQGDAEDTHLAEVTTPDNKGLRYFRLLGESYASTADGIRAFSQAYLASVAAVDDCIGEVVSAVDSGPLREDTIVIVTSDHGWTMGQKDFLFKNSLWEESTRVPFIVRAPGVAKPGGVARHPVSLIDLYPTLVDLCSLQGETRKNDRGAALDGHSVRPFLEDPDGGTWDGPDGALTMVFAGGAAPRRLTAAELRDPANHHWSLRTERWRYIRYNNGAEELYDHRADPREWNNLADSPAHAATKAGLRAELLGMID